VDVLHLIVLEVSNIEELIKRMKRRGVIEKRMDDFDEGVLRTRIQVYNETTAQLLKHYPAAKISRFNAGQRPLEVLRDVLSSLSKQLL
jgi:adenylate kinase family enzyme